MKLCWVFFRNYQRIVISLINYLFKKVVPHRSHSMKRKYKQKVSVTLSRHTALHT